jgi:hypothetical protein
MADWMDRAECRQYDPELFFPARNAPRSQVLQIIAICDRCGVAAECARHRAAVGARIGIWAGRHYKAKETTDA